MRDQTPFVYQEDIRLSEETERKLRRGRRIRRVVMLVVLTALPAGFLALKHNCNEQSQMSAEAGPAATATPVPPIEVATAAAITCNLRRGVEVVGSLAADEEVTISAQVAGELEQLNVDFGSYVTQGQVIAVIDQRDASLNFEQAEAVLKQTTARLGMKEGEKFDPQQAADVKVAKASLDWAKLELERQTKLIEKGDISRSAYDQAVINHNAAQAHYQAALDGVNQQLALVEQQRSALAQARKTISNTVVRAPISGAVKEKSVSRGSYLPVNGKIVTLVKINPLRLRAEIPAYAAASVRAGQTMNLGIESFPGRVFSGRVVRVGPTLDVQTRALTVEAEVANPSHQLRPGMFAKAQLITAKDAPALMVPQRAVVNSAGLSKVFVIDKGKAVERIVKTGAVDGDLIEITVGLKKGETVALSSQDKLQTGISVK